MDGAHFDAALFDDFFLGFPALATHAVHAVVVSLVDVALGLHALPHGFHRRDVVGVGGANEAVEADARLLPNVFELGHDPVAVFLRALVLLAGDALDLLPVLVGAGQEIGFVPPRAMVARERVGNGGRVERSQVRDRVDVIDGCGDVKGVSHGGVRLAEMRSACGICYGACVPIRRPQRLRECRCCSSHPR